MMLWVQFSWVVEPYLEHASCCCESHYLLGGCVVMHFLQRLVLAAKFRVLPQFVKFAERRRKRMLFMHEKAHHGLWYLAG